MRLQQNNEYNKSFLNNVDNNLESFHSIFSFFVISYSLIIIFFLIEQ